MALTDTETSLDRLRAAVAALPDGVTRVSFYVQFSTISADGVLSGSADELTVDLDRDADLSDFPELAGCRGFDPEINAFRVTEWKEDQIFCPLTSAFRAGQTGLASAVLGLAVQRYVGYARDVVTTNFLCGLDRAGNLTILDVERT